METIAPIIQEFYSASSEIIIGHDGIVDKFMGDACMALFNVPMKHDDHVAQAVVAGTEIQLVVPKINAQFGGETVLQIGVGITTGFALVGLMGSQNPSDYTAIGDVVNVAARLQGQAAPGEVIVSEEAYELVRSAFPNAKRQEYELKGINEAVVGYVLT